MFPYCHGMKGFLTKSVAGIYLIKWGFFKDAEIFLSRNSKYKLTQIFIHVLTNHNVQLKDDVFDYSYLYSFRSRFRFLSHVFTNTSDWIIPQRWAFKWFNRCRKILVSTIYSGDAADSAARARIVRGVEEIKCAFTKDATEEEIGQCTFGGCRVKVNYFSTHFDNILQEVLTL